MKVWTVSVFWDPPMKLVVSLVGVRCVCPFKLPLVCALTSLIHISIQNLWKLHCSRVLTSVGMHQLVAESYMGSQKLTSCAMHS
ncbi:hypothetical protein C8Q72DRAFT_864149 [Fomitopsis betulina]|nr:hypothetical protein C8Q72DRAFT_864149 [Fomitopsis betulina]